MAREPVFYSFHYDNDVFRVQQIRNMGVVEGNEPVSTNDWEQIKRRGDASVERWIDENMKYKQAYESGKGLFGIYIHNLRCPRTVQCVQGANPFDGFTINNGQQRLSTVIPCYDPGYDAYAGISSNLARWVASAISAAKYRWATVNRAADQCD